MTLSRVPTMQRSGALISGARSVAAVIDEQPGGAGVARRQLVEQPGHVFGVAAEVNHEWRIGFPSDAPCMQSRAITRLQENVIDIRVTRRDPLVLRGRVRLRKKYQF